VKFIPEPAEQKVATLPCSGNHCAHQFSRKTTAMTREAPPSATSTSFNRKQQLYARYLSAVLMDLTILNLFDEYWDAVVIDSFSISLLAAILLQVMLKISIAIEHHVDAAVQSRAGRHSGKARLFSAWAVLFISKLVILGALGLVFGDEVQFIGIHHGLIPFMVVVIVMLAAEELMRRIYYALASS